MGFLIFDKKKKNKNQSISYSQNRGHFCEDLVVKEFLSRDYKILHRRFKTPFAEIDIVAESKKGMKTFIEVKSLSLQDWMSDRISQQQMNRLKRSIEIFAEQWDKEIEFFIAFVDNQNKIQVIEINY